MINLDKFYLLVLFVTDFKVLRFSFMMPTCSSLSTSAATKVAFKARMDPAAAVPIPGSEESCFGPFNTNVPIPYSIVTLNDAAGYNPSLGQNHSADKAKAPFNRALSSLK